MNTQKIWFFFVHTLGVGMGITMLWLLLEHFYYGIPRFESLYFFQKILQLTFFSGIGYLTARFRWRNRH